MTKKLVAIIVSFLLMCTIVGCTTTNNSTTTNTAYTHDAFLENYLEVYKNYTTSNADLQFDTWNVTWVDSTSAYVEFSALNKSSNQTIAAVDFFTLFPTTQAATNRLNAMNMTAYKLDMTETPQEGAFQNVTQAPQVYKRYVYVERDPLNSSEYTRHEITQLDNLISVYTATMLS